MNYYKYVVDEEVLAIFKFHGDLSSFFLGLCENNIDEWHRISRIIDEQIDNDRSLPWQRYDITKVEFETYQAFGIKEIKLTSSESPSEKL